MDSLGGRLEGHQRLACELTVRNGLVVGDLNEIARGDWRERTAFVPHPEWDVTLALKRQNVLTVR